MRHSERTEGAGSTLPATFFISRPPAQALANYIQSLWIWRGDMRPDGRDRMMPTGAPGLIINLLDDETRLYSPDGRNVIQRLDGCGFDGAMTRPFVIDTAEQTYVAGVSFLPGGAWPFVNHAQDELLNQHLSLRDVWGPHMASLREQLLLAANPHSSLAILEQTLMQQLRCSVQRHPAVELALNVIQHDPSGVRIQQILQPGTLSARRLTRVFELETGLTPKRFARLMRFRRVLGQLHEHKTTMHMDWSDLALEQGYYDQAHFLREFKEFSGFTPHVFRPLMGEFKNHIAIA